MENNRIDLLGGLVLNDKQRKELEISEQLSNIIIKIVNKRISLGMSQRDLALTSGIKQPMIARIEKLDVVPRMDTILRLANSLDLNLDIDNKLELNVTLEFDVKFTQDKYLFDTEIYADTNKNLTC